MRAQIEDGVQLDNMQPGSVLRVTTKHTCYTIRHLLGRLALISGHSLYCPQPVLVTIHGSTWAGSWLKVGFVGLGMRLKFHHPEHHAAILTSTIQEIHECPEIESRWSITSIVGLPLADTEEL